MTDAEIVARMWRTKIMELAASGDKKALGKYVDYIMDEYVSLDRARNYFEKFVR
jgi:hypothetical protein